MQNRIGSGWSNNETANVDGVSMKGRVSASMRWNAVGPDYFHVLETPLLLGRDFTDRDSASAPKVVVVNQTFARKFFPDRSPLGHQVAMNDDPKAARYTIVGVAADSRYTGVRERPLPMAYFPYTQVPGIATMHFELRTSGDPGPLLAAARRAVREFGSDLPLLEPRTQFEQFQLSYLEERLFARLAVFFGLLAALLVATGLYGTLTYRVGRRTAEIGVRMALGAQRSQVLWMVLSESLVLSLVGIVVGLPLAFGSAQLLGSVLFGLKPTDFLTFAGALAGVALVTIAASLIPARRAAGVHPMVALRCE